MGDPTAPTIGRIVHYHDEGGPYAALIVAVHYNEYGQDLSVDLVVFGSNCFEFVNSVLEWRDTVPGRRGDDMPDGDHAYFQVDGTTFWTWPPRV